MSPPMATSRHNAAARWLGFAVVALVAAGVVISRRPDAFTNPQFYAEDGTVWYSQAYDAGPWQALTIGYQGHYLTQPRLVALLAAPFGPGPAPLIDNICGLLFQIAPVLFLLSSRFDAIVPSRWVRLVLGAVYLLLPSNELHVTIASAQFHLAVLAMLVVIAAPPRRWYWYAFDAATIALLALTGGFVYVLLPVALVWWWLRRHRWTGVLSGLLAAGLIVQFFALAAGRSTSGLDVTLHNLLLILSDRIFLAGLFAEEGHTNVFLAGVTHGTLIAAGVCLIALVIGVYAALRAPWELRLFAVFGFGIAAAGLAAPLVTTTGHQWDVIATTRAGERYFFIAEVAWVVVLLWCAARLLRGWWRAGAWLVVAGTMASGLVAAWTYPAFFDYHWPEAARTIDAAQPGTHLVFTINPGPDWAVDIVKR